MLGFVPVLLFLTMKPSGALSRLDFTFQAVRQCEPVSIPCETTDSKAPVYIQIVPTDSHPFTFSIPLAQAGDSCVTIPSLPLAAGSTFLISLEDVAGTGVARTSPLVTVLPSPSGNSSCLGNPKKTEHFFHMNSSLVARGSFDVSFDQKRIHRAPSKLSGSSASELVHSRSSRLSNIVIAGIAVSSVVIVCSIAAIIALMALRRRLHRDNPQLLEKGSDRGRTFTADSKLPRTPDLQGEPAFGNDLGNHSYAVKSCPSTAITPALNSKSSWATSTLLGTDSGKASPLRKSLVESRLSFTGSQSVCSQDMEYMHDIVSGFEQRSASGHTLGKSSFHGSASEPKTPTAPALPHTPTIKITEAHSGYPSFLPHDVADSLILPSPNTPTFLAEVESRPVSLPVSITTVEELGSGQPSTLPPNLPPFPGISLVRSLARTPSSRTTRKGTVPILDRCPEAITKPSRAVLG